MKDHTTISKGDLDVTPARPNKWSPRLWSGIVCLLIVFQALSTYRSPNVRPDKHYLKSSKQEETYRNNGRFMWRDIEPSESLEYHDCHDGFQCARLEVPLDYNRSDGKGLKVAIAIAKLPARVPISDSRYGGAILINPGAFP